VTKPVPNLQLRNWRAGHHLTREEMATRINATQAGIAERLACDDERIRRWETGEVRWPSPVYRRALKELTTLEPAELGFIPHDLHRQGQAGSLDTLRVEADFFDTMELARMVTVSDLGQGTAEVLQEAADLLCRAYPSAPAAELRTRTKQRLKYLTQLLGGRLTLRQHRDLLVSAGWLWLLLGCLHYDLGEREPAETARQAAGQIGQETGSGQLSAWACEMAAWFALTEGRYHDVIDYAQAGQQQAGMSHAMVQLVLQEARGRARLGQRREVRAGLNQGTKLLEQLPQPQHPEHHFVFDHTKWIFYAATCYTWLGDDEPAEEHAREIIEYHTQPDGSSDAPMRTANAHIDLGLILARHGELDEAVDHGLQAFQFERKTEASLLSRAADLDRDLGQRYPSEHLAEPFHEQYADARRSLQRRATQDPEQRTPAPRQAPHQAP
jgi:tetratricopeptide (TPR) repeat protein